MRGLCVDQPEEDVLGVLVDAPVDYEPRDFVLHLFASVCAEIVGSRRVDELRGRDRVPVESQPFEGMLSIPLLASVSVMLFGGGIVAGALWPKHGTVLSVLGGLVLFVLGSVLAVTWFAREGPRRRRNRAARQMLESGTKDGQTALGWLQQIWFQQSFSSGWSGAFKSPFGFEAGASTSIEMADRQMTFPEVVDAFRDFLKRIAQTRQVRIGIDELDKMDDETAHRFLNEIKVIFRVPGCFFLISISEDAMSQFERRGLPIRDVLDSSFDEVVWVPCLPLGGSRSLLARRIVGLPGPFIALLHCLSGGLPRDLIRTARGLVGFPVGAQLRDVSAAMIGDVLSSKRNGARVAARKFPSEGRRAVLIEWLDSMPDSGNDMQGLYDFCNEVIPRFLMPLEALGADGDDREREEIRTLGLQIAAAAYLSLTQLELFATLEGRESIQEVTAGEPGESVVDRLATIPQGFASDLGSTWGAISRLRIGREMESLEYPGRILPAVGSG
jgi:hypothetical protein